MLKKLATLTMSFVLCSSLLVGCGKNTNSDTQKIGLIVSTLNELFKSQGVNQVVTANQIALWSVPIAVISVFVGGAYALWFDKKLNKKYGKGGKGGIQVPVGAVQQFHYYCRSILLRNWCNLCRNRV